MKKVVLVFKDQNGMEKKAEVDGDFSIGRMRTTEGWKLTIMDEKGSLTYLGGCPISVTRLEKGETYANSPCHARFYWMGDRLFIQDMGSSLGTLLNSGLLTGWQSKKSSLPMEVSSSSEVVLGGFLLTIEPCIEKQCTPTIYKQLGLERVLGETNHTGPIIINIQNLDAGFHKNIDLVANRSNIDFDRDEYPNKEQKKKKNIQIGENE